MSFRSPVQVRPNAARLTVWLSLACLWVLTCFAQESFIVTLTQHSEPANLFATVEVVTNYVPGSATIWVRTTNAPDSSVGHHFMYWTLNGARVEDFTGLALNPADVALTNNVDAIAHYLPSDQDSDSDGLPDWYEFRYFNSLTYTNHSDPDGDGIDIGTERLRGYHPRLVDTILEDGISRRRSATVLVVTDTNYVRVSQSTEPFGFFNQLDVVRRGTTFPLRTIENIGWQDYGFVGWFVGAERVDDPQGFSKGALKFSITDDTSFIARYTPSSQDSDGDGLPDWFELRHFNSLTNSASSDPDGDGLDIATELSRGYSPNAPDLILEDGISRRRSATVLVVTDTNYVRVAQGTEPSGFFNQLDIVARGTNFPLRAIESIGWQDYGFVGWFVGSNRVDDPQGFSKGALTFSITNDASFIARYTPSSQDSDGDGLPDWFEFRHFNSLAYTNNSDPDQDGLDVATELARGYSPNAPDLVLEDGISRRRSATLNYVPAPPVIVSNPASWSGPAGSNLTLTVAARGAPPWNYRWLLNGVAIAGATNESLTLSNVQPTDSGLYSVAVANLYGATWSEAGEVLVDCSPLTLADDFVDRVELNTAAGLGRGSNTNATHQTGEPEFFQRFGSNSVWLAWRAPDSGIAAFRTRGSSFDTLLAAYFATNEPPGVSNLVLVARDDDRGGYLTSQIQFNAVSNAVYYLGVDGYAGDKGSVVLSWSLEITGSQLPVIAQQPENQVGAFGDNITFSVVAVSATPMSYQWFRGGVPLAGETGSALVLDNIGLDQVGNYFVRVSNTGASVDSDTVFLQINSTEPDGHAEQVAALEKLAEVIGLKPRRAFAAASLTGFTPQPARGLSGAQYYSTVANEGNTTTAWFKLEPQVSGPLLITTEGSLFDTHFKLYGGLASALVVSQLSTQSFAYNKGTDYRTRRITFDAVSNTTYYIQLDGGTQRGLVRFSWSQSYRSFIGMLPGATPLAANFNLQLTNFNAQRMQWIFNEQVLDGQTNLTFALPGAASAGSGDYAIEVTDTSGRVWRDKFYLRVLPILFEPPQLEENTVRLRFGATHGRPVIVQASSNLQHWTGIYTNAAPGLTNEFTDPAGRADRRYYRFVLPP